MLRLLRLERIYPEVQVRIVQYLDIERHRQELAPFDRMLLAGALSGTAAPDAGEIERRIFERRWSLSETNAIFRVMAAMRQFRANLATQATRQLEARIGQAVERSRQYLTAVQNEDGEWGRSPALRATS